MGIYLLEVVQFLELEKIVKKNPLNFQDTIWMNTLTGPVIQIMSIKGLSQQILLSQGVKDFYQLKH